MNSNRFHWHSRKTKLILFALAIYLTGIRWLAFCACRMLRNTIQRLSGNKQFSTLTFIDTRTFQVDLHCNWQT